MASTISVLDTCLRFGRKARARSARIRPATPGWEARLGVAIAAAHRAGRRRWRYPLLSAAAGAILMLALAWSAGLPQPAVHDEFAYLLGADTFASGRLTNPAHKLWPFFETIHVISQPTYAPKYQPGQSFFLALGQLLFGHPYYGVVLENVLLFAALCWMLQTWMAPGWALLGSMFAVISLASAHYWAISYWGGSLAACAGALLLVAHRRITYGARFGYGWLASLAIPLLLWTRPFEGGLLVATLGVHAILWFRRQPASVRKRVLARALVPIAAVVSISLGCQAVYNHAVTGSYFELPYLLAIRQYQVAPILWPAAMAPARTYRLEVLRQQHAEWEPGTYRQIHRMTGAQRILFLAERLLDALHGIAPLAFILPIAFLFWDRRSVRFLLLAALAGAGGLCLETWTLAHYLAPWFPLMLLLCFLVVRNLASSARRGSRGSRALAGMLLLTGFVTVTLRASVQIHYFLHPEEAGFQVGRERSRLAGQLAALGPWHVVMVRYATQHNVAQEWVYNGANIDRQPVVWAHDLGPQENRRLVQYFSGRKIWLLQPDARPPIFQPYLPTDAERPN